MVTHATSLDAAQLQFTDTASCAHWIESLPLTNVLSAQHLLAEQLALVRHAGIAPAELLRILEALRAPIHYVQSELARKYTGKPLPLDVNESTMWQRSLGLWQELADAYLACRDARERGDPALAEQGALIVQRCLRYTANALFEHYRIYRQAPGALWENLHRLYAFAEARGVSHMTVADNIDGRNADSSCSAAYCRALLAHLANPFALSGRQMEFLTHWIDKWSALVGLAAQPPAPSPIPAISVDLAGPAGPALAAGELAAATLRHLDLEQISRALRQTIASLKEGQTPAALGLGDDARQPGCENMLMLLYIQWCRAGTSRADQRAAVAVKAQVCLGAPAAHYFISGRGFRPPGAPLSRREEHDMQLFGHISERTEQALSAIDMSAVESWEVVNQSNSGFLCMLREADARIRISHNQLVAVRHSTNNSFSLGVVQWLRVEETSELSIGIRLLPGIARAAAARPVNFSAPSVVHGYERALLLPEMTVPATPATVILPSGWYQPGRLVEIVGEQKQVVKLASIIEKGSDFDRCAMTPV
jgi:hypothetical protein